MERKFSRGGARPGAGRKPSHRTDFPIQSSVSRLIHTFLKKQASFKRHTLAEEVRQRLEESAREGDDGR